MQAATATPTFALALSRFITNYFNIKKSFSGLFGPICLNYLYLHEKLPAVFATPFPANRLFY